MTTYTIGSFNLCKLNLQSDDNVKKNFDKIAGIIRDEKFDVIGLQEVINETAIKQIIGRIGKFWEYAWMPTKITASSKAQNEGYAFLWNNRRLNLVDAPSAIQDMNAYGIKKDGTGSYKHEGSLVRPPLIIRLTPKNLPGGSNFELRLINTHIAFSSPSNCTDGYSDAVARINELTILSQEVYRRTSNKRYGNNLPAYTILLGDYNLCLQGYGSPFIEETIKITNKRTLKTVQTEKTTLKRPSKPGSAPEPDDHNEERDDEVLANGSTDFYSKNYDHFSFEESLEGRLGLPAERVDALEKYYGNDLDSYRKEVSDHVPIKLKLSLTPGRNN